MADWEDKIQVKKGNIGEEIIKQFLKEKGFVIYRPELDMSHVFDIIAIKEKKQIIIVEVKTQARRNYYDDTGVTLKHYNEYQIIKQKYNLPMFLFFVDEMLKKIYGNWLSELEKPYEVVRMGEKVIYPLTQKGSTGIRVYFHLDKMIIIKENIDENIINDLKSLSTRNYEYLL